MTALNEDWDVWIEWYEDRLNGVSVEGKADLEIAKIESLEQNWKKGAKVANAELRRITDFYEPPQPAEQQTGPHFALDGDADRLSSIPKINDGETDWDVIEGLYPSLLSAADAMASHFGGGNNAHSGLGALATEYRTLLNAPVKQLPFAQLTGLGIRLGNAELAAQRDIKNRLKPELEDDEEEALNSLLDLHGPFIMATPEGQKIVTLAATYKRRPKDDAQLREDGGAVVSIGMFAAAGLMLKTGIPIIAGVGVVTGVISTKALRDSAIGIEWSDKMKNVLNGATEMTPEDLEKLHADSLRLQKFTTFILVHEERLRRIAGDRVLFRWLHRSIDWIKRNQPDS